MRISLALLASAISFSAAPAFADCTDTVSVKAATGYILKDVGVPASKDPVVQGEGTRTCGEVSYDVFISGGPGGKTADEVDLSLYYDTIAGPFKVQASAQYYFVNLDHSLADPKDDIIELYGDVSVPVTRGKVTIAPVLRVVEMVGIKTLPSLTLIQPGGRISIRVTDRLTLSSDVRYSVNLTQHYSTLRSTATASYRASDRLSISLGWEDTNRTGHVLWAGITLRR